MKYQEMMRVVSTKSRVEQAEKFYLLFRKPIAKTSSKTFKLLIAEDDSLVKAIYQHILPDKFELTFVSNGKEALNVLHRATFDALLTDINMPEMDGIKLAASIRNLATANSHIPIVGVSSNAEIYRKEALAAGMSAVFEKPIEANVLLTYFNKVLNKIAFH